jgi:phosphoribosylformylglycinamidine synthase
MAEAARRDLRVSAKVAVLVFPGTNSEVETVRICRDVGLDAESVHWSKAASLPTFDAYVLPGGFAYEDRIRAGAISAHDPMMDYIIEAAEKGKLILGICNGAQILLEAGLVPGTGAIRRPTAAFTRNAPSGKFICKHVHVKLAAEPSRCAITAALPNDAVIPAWAAHGEGRLAATAEHLKEITSGGHLAFVYAHSDGTVDQSAVPNGSALGCAGLANRKGNVLAIMPHPERDAWNFNHPDKAGRKDIFAPSGGAVFFYAFAEALRS